MSIVGNLLVGIWLLFFRFVGRQIYFSPLEPLRKSIGEVEIAFFLFSLEFCFGFLANL